VGDAEANKVSTQSSRRGTAVHKIAERYVLNEKDIYKDQMPSNVETFQPIKLALDEHVDNVMGIELPLYSKALGCAGRTDLIAEYDGVVSIIDYKTSRKEKKLEWIESYIIQTTIYAMMFERMYRIAVPQIAIIVSVDNEKTPQTFVLERDLYVDRVLKLFT
jgi:genome maintenance exonuclease 1